MQKTTELGENRSGMDVATAAAEMLENIELTRPTRGTDKEMARLRAEYAAESDPVGSIPAQDSPVLALLMDKLGERLAFERAGARLYDALIAKCQANGKGKAAIPIAELQHIREEEAMHFALLGAAIQSLGGDPTMQTPGADVTGVEGAGLMQVLTDPKTTPAQALHAILVAEMTDNAGWEELVELTGQAGNDDLVARFVKARDQEADHLEKVQRWYKAATLGEPMK